MGAMDSSVAAHLGSLLQARSAEISRHWYEAIAHTSFVPRPVAEVRAAVAALTERVIATLLRDPFAPEEAGPVGAALAQLHYTHPDALARSLDVLGRELTAGLNADQTQTLLPRFSTMMGAFAAGFYAQSRTMILEEQNQIRQALFVSRAHAEATEEARAVAEAAVQARTAVLNAAAHDLRAPVTTILGRADLLRLERALLPAPEWLRKAAAIRASALRIGSMVEVLLDAARLQTGQTLDLQVDTLDVGALVQATALPYVSRAGGAAPVQVDAPAGLLVRWDRARLERVVENVIANAVKYSPGGTPVWVTLRPAGRAVQIVVRDHGVGIPADDLPQLFTPFFRAATARGIPGIGIGLAGARTIVEQHGGTIAVDSEPLGGIAPERPAVVTAKAHPCVSRGESRRMLRHDQGATTAMAVSSHEGW